MTEITPQNTYNLFLNEDNQGQGFGKPNLRSSVDTSKITNFSRKNYFGKIAANKEKKKKKSLISSFFSDWSRLGLAYEDEVIANMRAIPADKNLLPDTDQVKNLDLFSQLNTFIKSNAEKNFYDKDFDQKREALRNLSLQPELEDILDVCTNEAILYDAEYTYFCDPIIDEQELGDLNENIRKKILEDMATDFRVLYKMLNWKTKGWDNFKQFLIDGILSWEIVWDSLEKPTKIIGIIQLDPATLTKKFDNGKWYWIQYKGIEGRERKLLDSQIIYISYQENNGASARISYLERLVRPFNIYRIVEQAQLIWTITNASYKMMFTIPIKGMSSALGKQSINSAMNRYREDIKFSIDSGELSINGRPNMPFNKEYWMPESDAGTPQIETLGGDGPDLSDSDQLRYFKNQLYKISKVPLNRFDQESGDTWFGTDATSVYRTEIDFGRFITRLRNTFSQIILKPLMLSLACKYKDIDQILLHSLSLKYNSYNLFEEMLEMELLAKRTEHIQSMKDSLVDMDDNGNEVKYFSSKFLVRKYLKMSEADMKLNEKYKKEETEELSAVDADEPK
jgi:capsid assembly protein (fragment)